MKMMDTRAYVGMLKELVEQGREVRMVISGYQQPPHQAKFLVGCP